MGKNQSASNITNIIRQDASGNIAFMSGSTMLMSLNNTGQMSGSAPAVSAVTASYADNFTVTGNLTAQTLVVQTITSSVDFVTGSTRFGSLLTNTHVFSGSVAMNPGGLFVSGSGQVGIGTTNPSTTLHLSTTNGVRLQYPGNTGYIQFTTNGSNDYIFSGFDGERMRLTSAGRLGIGTGSPSDILHASSSLPRVISDTSTRFAVFNLYYQGSEKGAFYLDNQNKQIIVEANGDNTYEIKFNTAGSERMRITSAGVVDISNRNLSKGSMPAGSVIQTVVYQLNSGGSTTSSTDIDTGLNASITPTSSTSKILVMVNANLRATGGGGNVYAYGKIWRGAVGSGTVIYDGFAMMGNYGSSDIRGIGSATILDSPSTTSSTTYRFSINSQYAGTTYLNSSTSPSTITLLEIAQ
jgi:hypothetical protein